MAVSITDQAIQAALNKNWHQAIELNRMILEKRPNHIPTLNRLAKAYKHLDKKEQAEAMYQKVLELDRFNSIAKKGLASLENSLNNQNSDTNLDLNFIQEPGRTKTITLKRVADSETLNTLEVGQLLQLESKKHCINVTTHDENYVGSIPDDLSYKLKPFLKAGNKYQVAVRNIKENSVRVFVKELERSPEFSQTPTFSIV